MKQKFQKVSPDAGKAVQHQRISPAIIAAVEDFFGTKVKAHNKAITDSAEYKAFKGPKNAELEVLIKDIAFQASESEALYVKIRLLEEKTSKTREEVKKIVGRTYIYDWDTSLQEEYNRSERNKHFELLSGYLSTEEARIAIMKAAGTKTETEIADNIFDQKYGEDIPA